jgi:hypothetical protein
MPSGAGVRLGGQFLENSGKIFKRKLRARHWEGVGRSI